MKTKAIALLGALLLVAACESTPEEDMTSATPEGGAMEGTSEAGFSSTDLGAGPMAGTQEDLEVNVGDTVFFSYDSAVIDATGQDTLGKQAAWLQQFTDLTVTIEGHADERGTRDYNLALGERRATAARNYLVALGIDPSRVVITTYGEERPVDPGHDEPAWQQNRRAVTVVNAAF